MKYQLPCKCGQSIHIEPSQAGQMVACVCGENVLVPSMLQVKALPVAPETVKPPNAETGTMRKMFFVLGIALLIPSVLLAFHLHYWIPQPRDVSLKRVEFTHGSYQRMLFQDSTPIPPSEHNILWMTDEHIDHMMPMELFFYFRTLEHPTFSYNFQNNYEAIKDRHRIWLVVNGMLFFLSLLSIVASFFMPKKKVAVIGWSGSEWELSVKK
jgi:hypothetical protein